MDRNATTFERLTRPIAGEAADRWLRAADAAALLLLVLALWVGLTGGIRFTVFGLRLSMTSAERLALVAAGAVLGRQIVWPRRILFSSLAAFLPRSVAPEWRATASIWLTSRLGILLVGYFAALVIGGPGGTFPVGVSRNQLLNLPARWDAEWYLDIAAHGYRWVNDPYRMQNVAFFPAVPLTMRVGGAALGAYRPGIRPTDKQLRLMLGGWIIAIATFWVALVYVYRWVEMRAGPGTARTTAMLLATYPFAVYFSAPYSEALYLLSITAVLLHFERGQWWRSAAWGFVAALVRPTGMLVVVPLAWIAARRLWRASAGPKVTGTAAAALAAPVVALLLHSFAIYQVSGRPFAWSEVQTAWGRTYQLTTWLGLELTSMSQQGVLNYVEATPVTVLNGMGAALAFGLLWTVARRAGIAYALLVLVNLVPAIASGGLMSVGRFTSTLFPMFFALATVVPERHVTSVLVAFSMLQGLVAVLFFTWRPPF